MSGPAETLELLLWVEQDRWRSIPEELNQTAFLSEQSVVINEFRETYEAEVYGQAWLTHPTFIYGENHPYGHPVIGDKKIIQTATPETVLHFFRHHYTPNNAILTVYAPFYDFRSWQDLTVPNMSIFWLTYRPKNINISIFLNENPLNICRLTITQRFVNDSPPPVQVYNNFSQPHTHFTTSVGRFWVSFCKAHHNDLA